MTSIRAALLGAAGLVFVAATMPAMAQIPQEILIGRKIAPVPLSIPRGVSPDSVYLGSYIVNGVADCNGCHSNNEFTAAGNPFNGQPKQINSVCYLNGGQSFGPFISRNITPDASRKPAGITFATFVNVMRTGQDPQDPGTLLQVMPWPTFQNMTDIALKAIYDYLSSIPSLPDGGTTPCAPPPPP
jgi:hypothetical protein